MQCTNCDAGGTPPIVYAGWMGTCGDKAIMTCSEMDQDCASKQKAFKELCLQLKEVLTSAWHLDFIPQNACYQPNERSSPD
jgi:hypothetical protein